MIKRDLYGHWICNVSRCINRLSQDDKEALKLGVCDDCFNMLLKLKATINENPSFTADVNHWLYK